MKEMLREKMVESGDFLEIDIFEIHKKAKSRKERAFKSRPVQIALNHKNSTRKLKWLLQANFTDSDYHVVLSYPADFDVTLESAKKIIIKFLRRVRNRFKYLGYDFKYVYVTEIGKKKGRPHHHLIASGDFGEEIFKIEWNKEFEEYKKSKETTYVWSKELEDSDVGYGALAEYLTKSYRYTESDEDDDTSEDLVSFADKEHALGLRSYTCSKNLKKPITKTRDGDISYKKLNEFRTDCYNRDLFEKRYPDYTFVTADPYWRDVCSAFKHLGYDYFDFPRITIIMKKKTSKTETLKKSSFYFEKPTLDEYGCYIDTPDYWDDDFYLPY